MQNEGRTSVGNSSLTNSRKLELFEECILPHLNAAYNLARWLTRNEQDAQDVVQEAYLRAFRFFDGFQGGDGKAWLLTVVRNTSYTWRKKEKRDIGSEPFDELSHSLDRQSRTPEDGAMESSRLGVLQGCMENLPPEYREVIVLRELEELSYKQIAEAAEVPVGTVMSRLARARKRLEDCAGSVMRMGKGK